MEKYCKKCGCKLMQTTLNSWWCSNCGKLPENQIEEEKGEEDAKYIG